MFLWIDFIPCKHLHNKFIILNNSKQFLYRIRFISFKLDANQR